MAHNVVALGGQPVARSFASLLAELACQHERLRVASVDMESAFAAAYAAARQLQEQSVQMGRTQPGKQCRDQPARIAPTAMKNRLPEAPAITKPAAALGDAGQEWLDDDEEGSPDAQKEENRKSAWHEKTAASEATVVRATETTAVMGNHLSAWELLEESGERRRSMLRNDSTSTITERSSRRFSQRSRRSSADYDGRMSERRVRLGVLCDEDDEDQDSRLIGVGTTRRHSCISASSCESWSHQMSLVRRNAIFRLRARLGKQTFAGTVTSNQVNEALTALGISKYSQAQLDAWLSALKKTCKELKDTDSFPKPGLSSQGSFGLFRTSVRRGHTHQFEEYLPETGDGLVSMRFKVFAEALLQDEVIARLEQDFQYMSYTIREVLFSGDANRLVAELTHVHVDDIAAPTERPDAITLLEPVVGIVIVLNGIFIGLESNIHESERSLYDRWFWGNFAFICVYFAEIIVRACYSGCRSYFTGQDKWWNLFDCLLLIMAVCDIALDSLPMPITVLRIMRLLRLTRLFRIFRLRYLKGLNLMVRGLIGGLYTLCYAGLLLFFTLYVIGVMATSTIGASNSVPEVVQDELFSSVPRSIMTCFRCFMSDCTTSGGKPIVKLLSDSYGAIFDFSYLASMVFVIFGLFNLIVAIYVENTMNAARSEGEKTSEERQRESLRIARLTRQLLKKFCVVQQFGLHGESEGEEHERARAAMRSSTFDDMSEMRQPISKEQFLCVIQDPHVQGILDELDIPPERAQLFDILDADCSGGLEVAELITGLLRVRGDPRKSDIIGALLGVRAVQDMVREQDERLKGLDNQLMQLSKNITRSNIASVANMDLMRSMVRGSSTEAVIE